MFDTLRENIVNLAGNLGALDNFRSYISFELIFGGVVLISLLLIIFYIKKTIFASLFSLYFSILLAIFLPLETQIARFTSFGYAPLIGFSAIFGVMFFMLSSIFSKRRLIRQDFSRISLLIIGVGFIGLFISTFALFSPKALNALILQDYSYIFDNSRMQTIWFFASFGTLIAGVALNNKKE